MPRYIDADALKADILKKYKQNWEVPCSYEDRIIQRVVTDLRVLIEQNTPADVVPKSEVDKWVCRCQEWYSVAELKSKRIVELEKELAQAKAEIAREIFEEIEKLEDELKQWRKATPIGCPECHRGCFSNDKYCPHCGTKLKR